MIKNQEAKNMEETAKEVLIKAIQAQPDDSSAEEIVRELIMHQMVLEGLEDVRAGRTISHEEMGERIKLWQK